MKSRKFGIQRMPLWGGEFEWNPEGSEGVSHMWILGRRGCSQKEHKWQRPHGKIVYGIFKEMTSRPVRPEWTRERLARYNKIKVNESLTW